MKTLRNFRSLTVSTLIAACCTAFAADKVQLKVVRVDSEETTAEDGKGANAVDGDPATFWHTQWQDANPAHPHEIIIELTPPSRIKGFTYLPRQDDNDHGNIKDYEFYAGNDSEKFGEPVKKGSFESGSELKKATFDPVQCRFVKLKALSEINDEVWTSAAEIGVIMDTTTTGPGASPAGLIHRYSFSGDANDSVGHANGALHGAAVIKDGQLRLDGSSGSYLELPGGLIAACKAVTFEFWASLGENRGWARVFDQGSINGANGEHDLYFCPHSASGDFRLTIMDPHPAERVVNVHGNLDNAQNLHVACVLDPASGFMGVYTNGVLAGSRADLKSLDSVATNLFFLGRSLFKNDPPLNGSIDEFRIYDGALSASAVAASFSKGPNGSKP
jgi:hypothetical protein